MGRISIFDCFTMLYLVILNVIHMKIADIFLRSFFHFRAVHSPYPWFLVLPYKSFFLYFSDVLFIAGKVKTADWSFFACSGHSEYLSHSITFPFPLLAFTILVPITVHTHTLRMLRGS